MWQHHHQFSNNFLKFDESVCCNMTHIIINTSKWPSSSIQCGCLSHFRLCIEIRKCVQEKLRWNNHVQTYTNSFLWYTFSQLSLYFLWNWNIKPQPIIFCFCGFPVNIKWEKYIFGRQNTHFRIHEEEKKNTHFSSSLTLPTTNADFKTFFEWFIANFANLTANLMQLKGRILV